MLDMYVFDVGGGGFGQFYGQNDEDQSDYDVEEFLGDMYRDEMFNESGNMSMDQSGNWYMGNFRGLCICFFFILLVKGELLLFRFVLR